MLRCLILALGFGACVAQATDLKLIDVTASSGLSGFRGVQGSESKEHIIEVMGGGVAFFDYDADGYLDILLVQGPTRS